MPNALAPKPKNSFTQFQHADPMMNQVPSINWEKQLVASKPPGYTLGQWLDELQRGLGRGIGEAQAGNIQSITDLVTRPRGVYEDLVQSAKAIAKDPSLVMNALGDMRKQAASGPYGLGQVVGGFLNPRSLLQPKAVMSNLDVYHGTPHTLPPEPGAPLGKFRSEKIGTGEGKQAYGYGLYFAENRGVGGQYRSNLSYRDMVKKFRSAMPDDADVSDALDWANSKDAPPEMARVIKELNANDWLGFDYPSQALNALFKEPEAFELSAELKDAADKMRGNLYKVDLPDEKINLMLDWDKPISSHPQMQQAFNKFWQSLSKDERAQAVFEEFGDYKLADQMAKNPGEIRGRLAYTLMTHHFGSQADASEFLRQEGIPGIKYLDAGSRKAEQGTRNFVVFPGEEKHLNVLSKE